MDYPAHMTDTAYRYDGSFQGFLCCVFESFARHELPAAIHPPEEGQTSLFGAREIPTDPRRAGRVAAALHRLGAPVERCVTSGFLADEAGKDLTLLHFLRLCFAQGPSAFWRMGDAPVAQAQALARRVDGEAGKYIEFLRFEEHGGMLGSIIHPRNRILPLLRGHFCSRLPDEEFVIFDATHGMALLCRGGRVQYLRMERFAPPPDGEEDAWKRLWQRFFHALTIEERRNERCQRTHAPKRYWQDMCEMAPEGRGQKSTTHPAEDMV